MKVYVVIGRTCEYSNKSQWLVRAFTLKASAVAFVEQANDWLKERGLYMDGKDSVSFKTSLFYDEYTNRPSFDPYFHVDYTGTEYVIEECDFEP